MSSINNLNSALDSLAKNQTLRVDTDGGNLHAVTGSEKIGLAFQKYILRKSPEQLGISQAKIAGALVGLYKNENPGVSNHQVGKLLDKLGFTQFAALIKSQPDLSARTATQEASPQLDDAEYQDDPEQFGTFTKKDPARAGVAINPKPQTHLPAAEIDRIVSALHLDKPEAEPAPVVPRRNHSQTPIQSPAASPKAEPRSSTATPSGPLPEHLASAQEIEQVRAALAAKDAALTTKDAVPKSKGPSAERLSAAASHGRDLAAQKAKPPATPSSSPVISKDVQAQIADVEYRLQLADQGKHLNAEGTRARPFKDGEKEAEVGELKAKLAVLKQQSAPAKTVDTGAAKLMSDLKSGAVHERNFAAVVFPLISGRLGAKASEIIQMQKPHYYHHLGDAKARYADIGVPKDTAVALGNGELFHANYIPLGGLGDPAIATQAPLAGTVKEFVQMIQEQNVTTIIDLTNAHDRETRLIPDYARKADYGFQSADRTSAQLQDAGIQKRELKTASSHAVSYLNFTNWPDKGVIELGQLQGLVGAIGQEHSSKGGGFAIHCTAGVGRTGTVYAALELDRLAKNGELTQDNFAEKVLDIVAEGRKARGFAFVQAPGQLNLLFDFAKALV